MIEPAWYDDEQDPSISRWHDGTDWTHHTVVKADWAEEPPPPTDESPTPALAPVVLQLDDVQPPPAPEAAPVAPSSAPEASVDDEAEVAEDSGWTTAAPSPTPPPVKQRGRTLLPLVGLLLVVAVGLRLFVVDGDPGDDDDAFASALPGYSAEWTTVDGSSYRITVVPSSAAVEGASPGGCLDAPLEGHVNVAASVRVENLSDDAAPVPNVVFGVNATDDGQLETGPASLAGNNHNIEVTPRAGGAVCDDAFQLRSDGRDDLAPDAAATFDVVVGGIAAPVPAGLALVVRYVQADPLDTTASTTADILAPFPVSAPAP